MNEQLKAIADALYRAADMLMQVNTKEDNIPRSEYLNTDQAAAFLGIRKSALYQLTHKNEISFNRPSGRTIFFHINDLREWQSRNHTKSNTELETQTAKNVKS